MALAVVGNHVGVWEDGEALLKATAAAVLLRRRDHPVADRVVDTREGHCKRVPQVSNRYGRWLEW